MVKLIQGDCLEAMRDMDTGSICLTVTSPPYDNLREYNGNNDAWCQDLWEQIIIELYRITKQGGVVVWVVADATINGSETGTSFRQALAFKDVGFNLHDTMIYKKNGAAYPASVNSNRYSSVFEYMFVFSKGKPGVASLIKDRVNRWAGHKTFGVNSERQKSGEIKKRHSYVVGQVSFRENIWEFHNGKGYGIQDDVFQHPATFPEQLARDHIISWSNPGDLVFDCFMGSGTTGKMAILEDRNFIGIELDLEYFKIAEERIKKAQICKKNIHFDIT